MRLDNNISELLHQYDCVIVPDLGGFVTNYNPAQLDEHSSIFSPPRKSIRFNSYLNKNDGLLATYIAEKNSLTFKQANKKIKKQVEVYFTKLNKGERVVFDKVGILSMDESKKIQFSPDQTENYLIESFGLRQVYAHAAEPEVEKQQVDRVPLVEKTPVIPVKKETVLVANNKAESERNKEAVVVAVDPKSKRKLWRVAAIAIPLILGGYLLYGPKTNSHLNLSNLNPFKKSATPVYKERTTEFIAPDLNIATDFPDLFEVPTNKEVVELTLTDVDGDAIPMIVKPEKNTTNTLGETNSTTRIESTYVAPAAISTLRYHIVGGCFSQLRNAEKKVRQIRKKGFDAFIVDERKGLYRVVYGSFNSRNKALILLQAVKQNEDETAWLLRK